VGQILESVIKAVMLTIISSLAAIAVEKIRRYNEDRNEDSWQQPYDGDYDRW